MTIDGQLFFRAAAKDKTESRSEIVLSFAADVELCHKGITKLAKIPDISGNYVGLIALSTD